MVVSGKNGRSGEGFGGVGVKSNGLGQGMKLGGNGLGERPRAGEVGGKVSKRLEFVGREEILGGNSGLVSSNLVSP